MGVWIETGMTAIITHSAMSYICTYADIHINHCFCNKYTKTIANEVIDVSSTRERALRVHLFFYYT